ncbi:hypothetical protein KUCAC02_020754, partial [Chaenocephalus aceratus]
MGRIQRRRHVSVSMMNETFRLSADNQRRNHYISLLTPQDPERNVRNGCKWVMRHIYVMVNNEQSQNKLNLFLLLGTIASCNVEHVIWSSGWASVDHCSVSLKTECSRFGSSDVDIYIKQVNAGDAVMSRNSESCLTVTFLLLRLAVMSRVTDAQER